MDIFQEMEFKLLKAHHIGGDAMEFPLLLSLHCNHPVFTNQVSERFRIARLKQFPFIFHHKPIESRVCWYHSPFSKQTAWEYFPKPAQKVLLNLITWFNCGILVFVLWLNFLDQNRVARENINSTFWLALRRIQEDESWQQHCTSLSCLQLKASLFSLEAVCVCFLSYSSSWSCLSNI